MPEKTDCIRSGCYGFVFLVEEHDTCYGVDELYYCYECAVCGLRGKKYSEHGESPKAQARNNFINGTKETK